MLAAPVAAKIELPGKSLSEQLVVSLTQAIESLPSPNPYVSLVQDTLMQCLQEWQDFPSGNSLFVLTNPVEKNSSLFEEVLAVNDLIFPIIYLSEQRPQQYREIVSSLSILDEKSAERKLVVIPHLSEYFLRCVGGLDGIICLRDKVVRDNSTFWLVGCNAWAWQYLDYVCQTHACFEQTVELPKLNSTEIETWLEPVQEHPVGLSYAESQVVDFEKLASLSLGVASVAARLWLQSLRVESEELIQTKASLPHLPSLTSRDRYLLYSLLLHERMSLGALATSLGETESIIRSDVQDLRLDGLIEGNYTSLQVNPLYYPRLYPELRGNNFLVTE